MICGALHCFLWSFSGRISWWFRDDPGGYCEVSYVSGSWNAWNISGFLYVKNPAGILLSSSGFPSDRFLRNPFWIWLEYTGTDWSSYTILAVPDTGDIVLCRDGKKMIITGNTFYAPRYFTDDKYNHTYIYLFFSFIFIFRSFSNVLFDLAMDILFVFVILSIYSVRVRKVKCCLLVINLLTSREKTEIAFSDIRCLLKF